MRALYPFLHAQLTNMMRWMHHIFTTWVFNTDGTGLRAAPDDNPVRNNSTHWQQTFVTSVAYIFIKFAEYSDVLERTRDDPHLGSMLAQMVIIAARDDQQHLLVAGLVFRNAFKSARITHSSDNREPWELDFYKFLEAHAHLFAETMVSCIWHYRMQSPLNPRHRLPSLLSTLDGCVVGNSILLDACIEENGLIRTATAAFCRVVDGLKMGGPRRIGVEGKPIDSAMAISTSQILKHSFAQGGPSLIRPALEQGLYRAVWSLRMLSTLDGVMSREEILSIDNIVSSLVDTIRPFLVYSTVFRRSHEFFHDSEQMVLRDCAIPSKLKGLDASLRNLVSMLQGETELRTKGYLRDFQAETSAFSDPNKFCDNSMCSSEGKVTKLWRCTVCRFGYYCSLTCQKAVWKEGHRNECKLIAANARDHTNRKETFPLFLPIHEREDIRRSLVPRFRHCRDIGGMQGITKIGLSRNPIAHMDITQLPVGVSVYNDAGTVRPGATGLTVTGKFAASRRVGSGLSLSVRDVPF